MSKHRKEIHRAIHKGYKLGVCDIDGNSVERSDGSFKSKPRSMTPTFRMRIFNGKKYIMKDGEWICVS